LFALLLWVLLLLYLFWSVARAGPTCSQPSIDLDRATILSLLLGVGLSGMVVDSFRFINFWLVLAIAAAWLQHSKKRLKDG
jgi:hypothetical protein